MIYNSHRSNNEHCALYSIEFLRTHPNARPCYAPRNVASTYSVQVGWQRILGLKHAPQIQPYAMHSCSTSSSIDFDNPSITRSRYSLEKETTSLNIFREASDSQNMLAVYLTCSTLVLRDLDRAYLCKSLSYGCAIEYPC